MKEWHVGLTEKQRRFCEAYAGNGGNALRAAKSAEYKTPHPEGQRMLQKPTIRAAIEALRQETTDMAILTREERQAWWTKLVRDKSADMKDRLRASELLGRSQGDFLERVEHSEPVDIVRIIEEARERRIKTSRE